jgi:hypothetical protein
MCSIKAMIILTRYQLFSPITVATRSKAWAVFARSNAEIEGSNPTQGMDVSIVCIYCVCVVLCLAKSTVNQMDMYIPDV